MGQKVALLMDTREAPAQPFTANTATLDFEFADAPPAGGTPLLRLKVDGIESIVVNRGARPRRSSTTASRCPHERAHHPPPGSTPISG